MTELWQLKQSWEEFYLSYKDVQFKNLEIVEITDSAYLYQTNLKKLKSKENPWPIYDVIMKTITEFIGTMQLLPDLRDESMRDRHWNALRLEVKEEFNENSDEFNLEEIIKLNFLEFEDIIADLASDAKKQMKVEKDLLEITRIWEEDPVSDLVILKEKSKADQSEYYKIGPVENIMTLIEEHTVILATHKASPFYREFASDIDMWEETISNITETLDLLTKATAAW